MTINTGSAVALIAFFSENDRWRMVRLVHRCFRQSAGDIDKESELPIFTMAACVTDYVLCSCDDCTACSGGGMYDHFHDPVHVYSFVALISITPEACLE